LIQTARSGPLRADAQRNRDALIHAAIEAFVEEGEDIALETIAASAGVGVGTLYRNFPNRDALIIAAYEHEVDSLCAAAAEFLDELPADEALHAWAKHFAHFAATKRGMKNALHSAVASDSPLFADTRERLIAALRLLLDAGADAGTVRADVDAEDVTCMISAICRLPEGPHWQEDVSRMLGLVIDGLRYGASKQANAAS
jgi:AcrR family transcriptional regulator